MELIQKTAFELPVGNNVFDTTKNIMGKFVDASGADSMCSAGFLCMKTELLENQGFAGRKNSNAWKMQPATSATPAGSIYALNMQEVNEITDPGTGAVYRLGANTLGLPCPAGREGTFTRIDFGVDVVAFGEGNFKQKPTTEQYATVANGLLVPTADKPASGAYFEIVDVRDFTVGVRSGGAAYLCAAQLASATVAIPAAPAITSPASFPHAATGDTLALSGTCESAGTVKVSVFNGDELLATVDAADGAWSYTLDTSTTGGSWSISLTQSVNGVVSGRSTAVSITRA